MPAIADLEFYDRREQQERLLADRAQTPEGRRAHLEMARCYARMIAEAQRGAGAPMRAVMPH
jgi:hypothetical protein